MAKTKDENGDGGKTENVDTNALIAQALQMLAANQPVKVIDESSPEYRARLEKEGFFDRFDVPVYQNGREAEPRGLSAETRDRASHLRPGTYIGGKVTVELTNNNGIHLKYKSNSVEDRMGQPWRSFEDLIDTIWAEMQAKAA